jgi:hypothetical protein
MVQSYEVENLLKRVLDTSSTTSIIIRTIPPSQEEQFVV